MASSSSQSESVDLGDSKVPWLDPCARQGAFCRFKKTFGPQALLEPSLLLVVDVLLEPSKASFLTFTNPYLYYLKGLIYHQKGERDLAQRYMGIGRGLVDPSRLEDFDSYWEKKKGELSLAL